MSMFDKLEAVVARYEQLTEKLADPSIYDRQKEFKEISSERSNIEEVVRVYLEYKKMKEDLEGSKEILRHEKDEDMREMAKAELAELEAQIPPMEEKLKVLLLPKDPLDDRNVIMEMRAGAGGDATASAVIANIIDIARRGKGSPMLGFENQPGEKITLMSKDNNQTKYYLRLEVADKSGTLAKIATILGDNDISIEAMLQKPLKNSTANLLLTTHTCIEKDILKAISELENSGVVISKPAMIRIEE